jgi:hypothetical protein
MDEDQENRNFRDPAEEKSGGNKQRCASSSYKERNRLSIMISNAKIGLNLLEDKINSFQNEQKQPPTRTKMQSNEYYSKNCNDLINQSDQHQYLYECLPYKNSNDTSQAKVLSKKQSDHEQSLILS